MSETDMFTEICPRCDSKDTEFIGSRQMRASDEPETMFYNCNGCNKRFRR